MSAAIGDPFRLDGKVALVTGASRGIGRAVARRLSAQGAKTILCSRDLDACESVSAELRGAGGESHALRIDLADLDGVGEAARAALSLWGRIDVLVANAGGVAHLGPMAGVSSAAFDATFQVNLKSYLWLCRQVLPGMVERRDGALLFIGSISGLAGERGLGVYALAKAAEMQLARNIAVEYGRHNVRANALAPGLVRTEMTRPLWSNDDKLRQVVSGYPLGRIAEPEDIAGAAAFLVSPAAAFITGQTLVVDGGGLIGRGTPV
ncbi:MAG: SDR family oxidoreductase [Burkholderiales bacterium]|nr:SDR family oxidoreductase [Burkholderiales bacterium]